ncbi:MAG: peptidoglycan-binding protein [Sarcina sp.]
MGDSNTGNSNTGILKIHCFLKGTYRPVPGAEIEIRKADKDFNNLEIVGTYTANSIGIVDNIVLDTPNIKNAKIKNALPYGIYNITVRKNGYKTHQRNGVQIFPEVRSFQFFAMQEGRDEPCAYIYITIPEHKQVQQGCSKCSVKGNLCGKKECTNCSNVSKIDNNSKIIPEKNSKNTKKLANKNKRKNKISKKNVDNYEDILRVLPEVEVPQYITVHDGAPSNTAVANYTVSFIDYIKNVASSEIYPTWDSNSIRANVYCIVSFVLNRVYTEWYPSQGYNFDITNDTAYDQAFVYGRTIYNTISIIVDELFRSYIQRWGDTYPMLSEFCNGTTSVCPDWLSQWGSQDLAEQGYTPYEILTYYYGTDLDLVQAPSVAGYPESYPGSPLSIGSTGESVKIKQNQLNEIGTHYPAIQQLAVDGIFGPKTQAAVKVFQDVFNLNQTGIIDSSTWYAISRVYVGVTGEASLAG